MRVRCSIVLWLALVISARAELQLVPKLVEYELDGAKMQRLEFTDGEKRVHYTAPSGWTWQGSATTLTLRPPAGSVGQATISRQPALIDESLDEKTIKRLTDELLGAAPPGAKNVSLVLVEKDPVVIERKGTLLAHLQYDFYGETQLRSVMFMYRPGEQMRFQLTAPKTYFPDLQKAFLASHFSWQNL